MSSLVPVTEPANIIIIGASGDLTQRKLVPALHSLGCEGLLFPLTHVIGLARSALPEDKLREQLFGGVVAYARRKPASSLCELWP